MANKKGKGGIVLERGFGSDNSSGVHPKILDAIIKANTGHCPAYGNDPYTESAIKKFKNCFGKQIEVYFVFNGTGANIVSLRTVTHSFNSIICAETAHLYSDECAAPEKFIGCKLIPIPTQTGKITAEQIEKHAKAGNVHHAQPRAISITQPTEQGTLYTLKETKEIAKLAHKNGLLFHIDGARIANAAVALKRTLKEITFDAGADILSFGGTKNGVMFGEAVIFANKELAKDFPYIRKQGMQLASKMRFISVQFETLLTDNLWFENAQNANSMAKLLASEVSKIPEVKLTQPVETNGVFAKVPKEWIKKLQSKRFFYIWNEAKSEVRWMMSFDTRHEDIMDFVAYMKILSK